MIKLLLLLTILSLTFCSVKPSEALDSNQPLGTIYQLLPFLFPRLKPSSDNTMKTYFIPQTGSSAFIKGKTITLTVPYSTDLNSLVAEFYQTGDIVTVISAEQTSNKTENNYNNSLEYTITAKNKTTRNYSVSTSKGSPNSNHLLNFSLSNSSKTAFYEGILYGNFVFVPIPFGTDIRSLIAIISHNGKEVKVNGLKQTSGTSTQNFSNSVIYSIYSELGANQDYTINASVSTANAKEIKSFWLDSVQASIQGSDILVFLPSGYSLKNLIPSFIHTGSQVKTNGNLIQSGESDLDFTNPIAFTVVANDGSTKNYKVIANVTDPVTAKYSIGGFVSGLNGTVALQNNGGDNKYFTASGSFSFNTSISHNGAYSVTVLTNPINQYCTVTNETGIAIANVANISVDCNNNPGTTVQNFTDLGDDTVKDNNTGLVWMKCSMSNVSGVPCSGSNCLTGTPSTYNFCSTPNHNCNGGVSTLSLQPPPWLGGSTSALWTACNNANTSAGTRIGSFAGKTNWRVPNRDELISLVDYSKTSSPAINTTYFPGNLNNFFSSTPEVLNATASWVIYFNNGGNVGSALKSGNAEYLRCVSGP